MKDPAKLHEAYGETVELVTPSGFRAVIRQQNGEDDDIISNSIETRDGTAANRFIAGIVVDTDLTPTSRLTLEDVLNLKISDKYYLLIASRIFSLGQFVRFSYRWEDIPTPVEYEEDLSQFIWDYSRPFPYKTSDEGYYEFRIVPHKAGKETTREFATKSGKRLKYDYMNGHGEKYMLTLPDGEQSRNKELIARNLQQWVENKWVKVESFRNFSPIDMVDIRRDVKENDEANTDLVTMLEHPKSHIKVPFSIVATPDFFFPRTI